MTKERKVGLALLTIGLLAALAVAAVVGVRESQSLYYTMTFDDAKGLRAGDPVQMNGVEIGAVKYVQLQTNPPDVYVRVKIEPKYAEAVRAGSTGVIREAPASGNHPRTAIEVINPEGEPAPPPLPKDSFVKGRENPVEVNMWRLSHRIRGTSDEIGQLVGVIAEQAVQIADAIQKAAESPEAKRTLDDLQTFVREMNEQGRAAAAELRRQWPELEARLRPTIKHLQEYGHDTLADQVRQIMRQIDETLDRWPREPQPTPTPVR